MSLHARLRQGYDKVLSNCGATSTVISRAYFACIIYILVLTRGSAELTRQYCVSATAAEISNIIVARTLSAGIHYVSLRSSMEARRLKSSGLQMSVHNLALGGSQKFRDIATFAERNERCCSEVLSKGGPSPHQKFKLPALRYATIVLRGRIPKKQRSRRHKALWSANAS
ncbi:hypothetical protein FVEG_15669 [Fusarium verticillioides 7600]|uniref:Uncharacterized protein n=1 Tax=Gibberella moniliformis (strain M3125 / FGSC 7600) TaxID=334819 RepID=W7MAD2_GIBM7|nr:hypothetical protein FVEG_15669 [Fusarium verticillioides 7600]EWG44530.1 hypothetical protein FVEG_15669 [Fusarium verticillioides 7600]